MRHRLPLKSEQGCARVQVRQKRQDRFHEARMRKAKQQQVDAGKRELERDINLVRESTPDKDEDEEPEEEPMEVQPVVEKQKQKQQQKEKVKVEAKAPAQKAPAQKEKKREKLRIPVERGRQRMAE